MADPVLIQRITNALEATYRNLKASVANISGLLAVGRATCDEVSAYNLWALATYDAQRGMLATLRAAGEANVAELPPYPTLFAWQGVDGSDALNIDCSGQASSLSGAMAGAMGRALRGPTSKSVYLGADQIRVITTDQWAYSPESSPSWTTLVNVQAHQAGLGIAPIIVLIVIAGISIGVAVGLSALAEYMQEKAIQEETTERTRVQSDAFQKYTAARLACYSQCLGTGKSNEECSDTCTKLIPKPDIKIDSARGIQGWGLFQWVGAVVVIGAGALVAYKLYERKASGKGLLPDIFDTHAA